MAKIYLTAADHINHHPYQLMVPAYYAPVGDAVLSGEVAPIYQPIDGHVRGVAWMPIKQMVIMYNTGVGFDLVKEMDIATILHQIDAYLEEVYETAKVDERVRQYLIRIKPLRDRFYICFLRLLNKHPELKKIYSGEDKGIMKLLQEMLAVSGAGTPDAAGNFAIPPAQAHAGNAQGAKPLDPSAPISSFYDA